MKNLTAFGWADQLNPVLAPDLFWLLPFFTTTVVVALAGICMVAKRDLRAGLIPESNVAKSRFILLGSAHQFSLRQQSLTFISWGVVALCMSGLLAAITNVAAQAVSESPVLGGAIAQLAGSVNDLKMALLGTGLLFTVVVLLIMVTVNVTVIRSSEAKNYLDTLLATPLRRSSWLLGHFVTIVIATLLITLLCAVTTWVLAQQQSIPLELDNALLSSLSLTGVVIFLLGLGLFLYGLWPKIAVLGMYAIIAWSFLVDLLSSMLTLPDILVKSSLFHYLSLSLADSPDWVTFTWLMAMGIILAALGVVGFTKRDLVAE